MLEKLKEINHWLLQESPQYIKPAQDFAETVKDQFALYRALVNIREPKEAEKRILQRQDEMLQEYIAKQGIVQAETLQRLECDSRLSLWKGDITQLAVDGIVNAANSQMLGCFIPGHGCIDNIIHTKSGMQLRAYCARLMEEQGHEEPVGRAKITPAFNLPSRYIFHTVGPQVYGALSEKEIKELASCYREILALAEKNNLSSLAFCCISTGVFHFPPEAAAQIAISTVKDYLDSHPEGSLQHVIFNVFSDQDLKLYQSLFGSLETSQKAKPEKKKADEL